VKRKPDEYLGLAGDKLDYIPGMVTDNLQAQFEVYMNHPIALFVLLFE
jgi:hypothetical protein